MRRQIVASQRAGESVTRIAERLLDHDRPRVELPAHVRELRRAAGMALEAGDQNFYEAAVERWAGRVERLGEGMPGGGRRAGAFTMRSATQQLVKDLRTARPQQVQHLIDRWVLERARYQARVVARTETVEAFRDGYRRGTERQPYVKGYRWVLSNRHPKPDVCDLLAHQNLYELGPGGYPANAVPATPHPLDLCSQVAIIDEAHFRRELARVRGEQEPPRPWEDGPRETAQEWLRRQPVEVRRAILGPTRMRMLARGADVVAPNGVPIPVHALLGRPPRVPGRGPRVNARPIIEADRAAIAAPFTQVHGGPTEPPPPPPVFGRRIRARRPKTSPITGPPPPPAPPPPPPPPAPPPPPPPPAATTPSAPSTLADLRDATPVRIVRPMGKGANDAVLIELRTADGRTITAVYKDVADEAYGLRANIRAGTYADREAAMYALDVELGGETVVPPTVVRDVALRRRGGQTTRGSLQLFNPDARDARRMTSRVETAARRGQLDSNPSLRRMALLDLIAGNDDRHIGNYMVRVGEPLRFVAIDNGLTFAEGRAGRFLFAAPIETVPRALLELDATSIAHLRALDLRRVAQLLRSYPGIRRTAAQWTLARIRALQLNPRRLVETADRSGGFPAEYIAADFVQSPPDRLLDAADVTQIDAILDEAGY